MHKFVVFTLMALAFGLADGKSTKKPADRTYTECYDDGSHAEVSEWDFQNAVEGPSVRYDSSNSYKSSSNSNTENRISSKINTNSGNNNYEYNYYGGYWYDGVWYEGDGETYAPVTTTTTTTQAPSTNRPNRNGNGNQFDNFRQGYHGQRGSLLGDILRLPGQVAGGIADGIDHAASNGGRAHLSKGLGGSLGLDRNGLRGSVDARGGADFRY